MRAAAAFAVVLLHVGFYTGLVRSVDFNAPGAGFIGVVVSHGDISLPIFFVISGLLLYWPFAKATIAARPRLPRIGPYLWRRALRILPAYWVMIVVALLYFSRDSIDRPWVWVRSLLLLHIYQQNALPLGAEQTWSVATEASYYLLLPLFALLLHRYAARAAEPAQRARRLLAGVVLLGACSLPWTVYAHWASLGQYPPPYFWLPEYISYIAAGMALAVLLGWQTQAPQAAPALMRWVGRRPLSCWVGALVCFAAALTPLGDPQEAAFPTVSQSLTRHVIYTAWAFLVVAPLVLAQPRSRGAGLISALLANPVVRYCGRVSYGVFLWHLFVVSWYYQNRTPGTGNYLLVAAIVLGCSLMLASLSWVLVERPAQQLRSLVGKAPKPQTADPIAAPTPSEPLATPEASAAAP